MFIESGGEIRQRDARVLHLHAGRARLLHFAFGDDHGRPPFDCLVDELVAIAFLTAKGNEKAVLLHSPRVIRDAFHRAINRADDRAGGNRGEESS